MHREVQYHYIFWLLYNIYVTSYRARIGLPTRGPLTAMDRENFQNGMKLHLKNFTLYIKTFYWLIS